MPWPQKTEHGIKWHHRTNYIQVTLHKILIVLKPPFHETKEWRFHRTKNGITRRTDYTGILASQDWTTYRLCWYIALIFYSLLYSSHVIWIKPEEGWLCKTKVAWHHQNNCSKQDFQPNFQTFLSVPLMFHYLIPSGCIHLWCRIFPFLLWTNQY